MATGLALLAVILSIGNLLALLFVVSLVVTLTRPDRKQFALPIPAITDAKALCEMCVWCGKEDPSGTFGREIEHATGCPTVTDVWPVQPFDIEGWLTCEICSHVLQMGETYTTARDVRCIGCTVSEASS